jgi:U3 small nucleolar RNA-associated protein 25
MKRKKLKVGVYLFELEQKNELFIFLQIDLILEHDEFSIHFGDEFSTDIKESVELFQEAGEKWQTKGFHDPTFGNVSVYDIIQVEDGDLAVTENMTLGDFFVKKKLHSEWLSTNSKILASSSSKKGSVMTSVMEKSPFTELQRGLFGFVNKYKDCLFSQRSHQNATELRNLYCLHALNHVFK